MQQKRTTKFLEKRSVACSHNGRAVSSKAFLRDEVPLQQKGGQSGAGARVLLAGCHSSFFLLSSLALSDTQVYEP